MLIWSLLTSSGSQLHEGGHGPAYSAWSPTLPQGQSLLATCTPESKSLLPCPCHTASPLPPLSMWSASTSLPYSPLWFPPPSPSPPLQSLLLGLAWEDCSCSDLGAPEALDSHAAPSLRGTHAHALGTHSAAAISLSDSHQTSWMGLNKGSILNHRVLFFPRHFLT